MRICGEKKLDIKDFKEIYVWNWKGVRAKIRRECWNLKTLLCKSDFSSETPAKSNNYARGSQLLPYLNWELKVFSCAKNPSNSSIFRQTDMGVFSSQGGGILQAGSLCKNICRDTLGRRRTVDTLFVSFTIGRVNQSNWDISSKQREHMKPKEGLSSIFPIRSH